MATFCTSAPTFSQRSAISLMNVTFIARKELPDTWSALKNLSTPSIKGFPSVLKYWKLPEIVGDVADFWCFWYAAKSSLFR